MLRRFAAALLAASMITAPALAEGTTTAKPPAVQTTVPDAKVKPEVDKTVHTKRHVLRHVKHRKHATHVTHLRHKKHVTHVRHGKAHRVHLVRHGKVHHVHLVKHKKVLAKQPVTQPGAPEAATKPATRSGTN